MDRSCPLTVAGAAWASHPLPCSTGGGGCAGQDSFPRWTALLGSAWPLHVGAAVAILQHRFAVAGIPEIEMTALARHVDGAAGGEQLVGVARLDDRDHLEGLRTKVVGVRVPERTV